MVRLERRVRAAAWASWVPLWLVMSAAAAAADEARAPRPPRPDATPETPTGPESEAGADEHEDAREPTTAEWLAWAIGEHGFSDEETAAALGLEPEDVRRRREVLGIVRGEPGGRGDAGGIRVLPYPGGRHPRIGFLDGAIDPHRDTKATVFLPWEGAGYVVVDLPEALWRNAGTGNELTYLAHTHIPTVWDRRGVELERTDWRRADDGTLLGRRRLPDGLAFETKVRPERDSVDLEMTLRNGTETRWGGLRTQICVLLKGAPGFAAQTNDNKVIDGRAIAVRAARRARWVVTAWERAEPWANPPCPCMHSDPVFPELDPGEEATVRGRMFFHEGEDVREEIGRRREEGTLLPGDGAP